MLLRSLLIGGMLTLMVALPPMSLSQASKGPPPLPANPFRSPSQYFYYSTPLSALTRAVLDMPAGDQARFDRLRTTFFYAGCRGSQMTIEAVSSRHSGSGDNLICTWPGNSPSTIVVVAHYARQGKGQSAIDDWSGAILLPFLYLAIQIQPRENTWVFLESSGRQGTDAYLRLLSRDQKRRIRAVIGLDSLGLAPATRYFSPGHFPPSPTSLRLGLIFLYAAGIDNRLPTPLALNPKPWLRTDDTQPFRRLHIPTLLVHSVPEDRKSLPGSSADQVSAIDPHAYYQNYRALAVFLVALDSLAARIAAEDIPR